MTIRRQLLNFGSRSTDFRLGVDALQEAGTLLAGTVAKPKRAVLVHEGAADTEPVLSLTRALVDAGFAVTPFAVAGDGADAALARAQELLSALAAAHITSDDLIVALGGHRTCSLAAFCARAWCAGTTCAVVPTTLDAMVCAPTQMMPLAVDGAAALVELAPELAMSICDLAFIMDADDAACALGAVKLVGAYLAESRTCWDKLEQAAAGVAERRETSLIDALCTAQTARLNIAKSVSPSARAAGRFGTMAADALRACLPGELDEATLLAEGMRFEARLAHEVTGFALDDVFALDDRLEDLHIEEAVFTLDADRFCAALAAERLRRANRLLFALPKHPGTIRLTSVEPEVLHRHAAAYLASRAAS